MRQTGGVAVAAISTRSTPFWRARASASLSERTPSCLPSGPMTRTSRARIFPLILVNEPWEEELRGEKGRLKTPSTVVASCILQHQSYGQKPLQLQRVINHETAAAQANYLRKKSVKRGTVESWNRGESNPIRTPMFGVLTAQPFSNLQRPHRSVFDFPALQIHRQLARPVLLSGGHEHLAVGLPCAVEQRQEARAALRVQLAHHVVNQEHRRTAVDASQKFCLRHFKRDGQRALLPFAAELRGGFVVQQQLQIVPMRPDQRRAITPVAVASLREFDREIRLYTRLVGDAQLLGVVR